MKKDPSAHYVSDAPDGVLTKLLEFNFRHFTKIATLCIAIGAAVVMVTIGVNA